MNHGNCATVTWNEPPTGETQGFCSPIAARLEEA
jgi:hypothetical protein